MSSTPKVWVVKEQSVRQAAGSVVMDYSPAMKFGDIEFITDRDLPLYRAHASNGIQSRAVEQWRNSVDKFVEEYNPSNDYIVATGQPMAIFLIGYALAKAEKPPRFLVWRREDNDYQVCVPASLAA